MYTNMKVRSLKVCFVLGLFLLTSIFFSTISARASTTNLVENEFTAEFSPLVGNPDEAGNMYDETNRSEIRTGFNTWEEDWGEGEVPKGIYVGTAFAPSVLDTGIQRVYRRCVFEVGFTANFSAKEIMNGASSFWVKIPVVFDDSLFNLSTFYPHHMMTLQPFINGFFVHSPQTIVVGSSVYVNFHYIIQPETDYEFLFRFPIHYWSPSLIPVYGNYDHTISPKVLLTDEKVSVNDNSFYSWLTTDKPLGDYMTSPSYDDFDGVSITQLPSSVSLGFSFIFTNGIGIGGLFGRSYNIVPYSPLSYSTGDNTEFKIVSRISHDGVSGRNVSIVIPFYSIDPVYLVRAEVFIYNSSHARFGMLHTDAYNISNNYSGMFIFSFPSALTLLSPPSAGIPVAIYLYVRNSIGSVGSITFLHSSNLNASAIPDISGTSLYFDDTLIFNYYAYDVFSWHLDKDTVSLSRFMYYDFVCYSEMKDGMWAWVWHNASGGVQYDYVFRQKIYVPITIYNVTNGDTGETVYVGTNGYLYDNWISVPEKEDSGDSDYDWIAKLSDGIKRGIEWLWNGMNKMSGYIIDGIQALGEALYKLGELVVTSLMKFWGILQSIVAFIEDNILNILELLVTTASAFLFLLIMPVVSRSFKSFFAHVGGNV